MQIRTNQFQKEVKEHGNYNFPLLVSSEKLSKYESEKCTAYELDLITKLETLWKLLFLNNDKFSVGTPYDQKSYDRIRDIISYIETNYASNKKSRNNFDTTEIIQIPNIGI